MTESDVLMFLIAGVVILVIFEVFVGIITRIVWNVLMLPFRLLWFAIKLPFRSWS